MITVVSPAARADAHDGRAQQVGVLVEDGLALVGEQDFLAGIDALGDTAAVPEPALAVQDADVAHAVPGATFVVGQLGHLGIRVAAPVCIGAGRTGHDDLARHAALHDLILRKRLECLAERHGQALHVLARFDGLVNVALFRLARIEVVVDAVVGSRQNRRAHQVRIHHGIHRAVLEPPGGGDAQARGAVLEAPVGEDRRPEARIPQPAIGVHRRGADGRQRT